MLAIDADGTIRESVSGDKFIKDPNDQQPRKGAIELLQEIKKQGHSIYIVTNQGGISAGFKTLESAIEEQLITLQMFPTVSAVCMADDYTTSNFWFIDRRGQKKVRGPLGVKARKPDPGMLYYLEDSINNGKLPRWVIGSRDADEVAADRAGWDYLHINRALEIGKLPE